MVAKENSYHRCLDRILQKQEQLALKAFNNEVIFLRGMSQSLQIARINALRNLKEDDILHLAVAFRRLYPHWFTNGRGTKLDFGASPQYKEVCFDVVWKLNTSSAHHFADITRLFDLSGDGALPTGRRPLAHSDKGQGYVRTRMRTRSTQCRFHPDKKAVARDLCARCYNRVNSLGGRDIFVELFPPKAMKEIMLSPRPSRSRPLYKVAQEIMEKYEEAGHV
jgi:hypothetical protein